MGPASEENSREIERFSKAAVTPPTICDPASHGGGKLNEERDY